MKRDVLWRERIFCPLVKRKAIPITKCTNKPCCYYDGKSYGGLYGKIECLWKSLRADGIQTKERSNRIPYPLYLLWRQ